MFPEQIVEMENEEHLRSLKGFARGEDIVLKEEGERNLVGLSAHDLMAKRISEAKETMRRNIEEERLTMIERKRRESTEEGARRYRVAAKDLAYRYFGIATHDFKPEDHIALDNFLRKEILKSFTFHSIWNAVSTFGIFSLAYFTHSHYGIFSSYLGKMLLTASLLGAFLQFVINIKMDWDDPGDSELRFLKYHFSFLWNRRYFLADAKERQQKELATKSAQ